MTPDRVPSASPVGQDAAPLQTPSVTLRPPDPGEVEDLARLHVRCWQQAYSHLLPAEYFDRVLIESRRRLWRSLLGRDPLPDRLVVAESAGQLIGFAMAGSARGSDPARDHELFSLYLDAAEHGHGAGQALLDAVLGDLPAQLWVARDNPRARAFYARNGFRPDGVETIDPDLYDLEEVRLVR